MTQETAFDEGQLTPVSHFQFDAVDSSDPLLIARLKSQDRLHTMAEAFNAILTWVWQSKNNRLRTAHAATARLAAMTAAISPQLLGNESYRQIGRRLKVSRAMVSKLAVQFQEQFGVHFRRSKREGTREIYASAQRQHRARTRSTPTKKSIKPRPPRSGDQTFEGTPRATLRKGISVSTPERTRDKIA